MIGLFPLLLSNSFVRGTLKHHPTQKELCALRSTGRMQKKCKTEAFSKGNMYHGPWGRQRNPSEPKDGLVTYQRLINVADEIKVAN